MLQGLINRGIFISYQRDTQKEGVLNMSFVANEGTRLTIVSNNWTFKVVREYMEDFDDVFRCSFERCVAYCANKVSEINEAVIF